MPDSPLNAAQKKLTARKARDRRKALGPPLAQDDATLTAKAEVGPADMSEVEAFVRDAAGQRGVDMLRARRG